MSHQRDAKRYASWNDEEDDDEDGQDPFDLSNDPFAPQLQGHSASISSAGRVRAPTFAGSEPPSSSPTDTLHHSIRSSIVGFLEANGSLSFVGMETSDLPRSMDTLPPSGQQQRPFDAASPTPPSFQNFDSNTHSSATISPDMPPPPVAVPLSPTLEPKALKQPRKRTSR